MVYANKLMRLDQYVLDKNPSLSRSYVSRLIIDGQVLVNGQPNKPGYRIREHDKVKLQFDLASLQEIADIDLPILYEDKNILVVNKPVGVISHSRSKYWNEPSVSSFLRQHIYGNPNVVRLDELQGEAEQRTESYREYDEGAAKASTRQIAKSANRVASSTRQQAGTAHMFGERAGIVHRLDRATSGVMICAKNIETLKWLQKQFSSRKVIKTYIAVVGGTLKEQEAVIDMPIERNPKAPATFRANVSGKQAQTKYRVLQANSKHSLLELQPLTGRTHQLRVHLEKIGHPIVGDNLYGGEEANRLFLHALSLKVSLPDGVSNTFEAPLPKEFEMFMEKSHG